LEPDVGRPITWLEQIVDVDASAQQKCVQSKTDAHPTERHPIVEVQRKNQSPTNEHEGKRDESFDETPICTVHLRKAVHLMDTW